MRKRIGKILDFFGKVKLLHMFAAVLCAALLVWGVSFYATNYIARDMIDEEYTKYNETLFEQMYSDLNRGLSDLTQIAYYVMANKDMTDFLMAESFISRNDLLERIQYDFNQIQTIQSDIEGIQLYDGDGKLVASTGVVYLSTVAQPWEDDVLDASISFLGPCQVDSKAYFGMMIPMFSMEKTTVIERIGSCFILIDTAFFDTRISNILYNEEQWCIIVAPNSNVIFELGVRPMMLEDLRGMDALDPEMSEQLLVYNRPLGKTGWSLVFSVTPESIQRRTNQIQYINLLTFLIIGLLVILLFGGIYVGFLRPVRQQIHFMNYYAQRRTSRMQVRSHNEMGVLAENLNKMLDDLEKLNEENLRASKRILEADYQKKQSELLAYRNQINPHFLNNTFECIRGMALFYDVPDIASISESLAKFFEYSVRGKGYADLSGIREHIMDYASIIGYRFMNKYQIIWESDESLNSIYFPKMIIQPLVENAIFHGLETVGVPGSVFITVSKKEDKLSVFVRDTGCGMSAETLASLRNQLEEFKETESMPMQKHGIGMLNIYRRLNVFYNGNFTLWIDSEANKGTQIEILVPIDWRLEEAENVQGIFD